MKKIHFTFILALIVFGDAAYGIAGTHNANPSNYQRIVSELGPGETVNLTAGRYPLLNLTGLNGTAAAWITIQGPASGSPAVITVNPSNPGCCNLVQLGNSSYLALKNLKIDSAMVDAVDGVNASSTTHDILIENCSFVGQGAHQSTVAINTKGTAWNWVIRGNTITEAGTGWYFGNHMGEAPFINGLIEGNLIIDTIGYNGEIKWQLPYSQPAGLDAGPHKTIIRHNVFIKSKPQSYWPADHIVGPRANMFVGGFPTSGYGSNDSYEIYGNFFYENKDGESMLQASGVVSAHDNIFAGGSYRAMDFVNHYLPIRRADVYNNTIYGQVTGIYVSGASLEDSFVSGNLILANQGVVAPVQNDNIVDTFANAGNYVNTPSLVLGTMNLYPRPDSVRGTPLELTHSLDFNGTPKGTFEFRGAYAGEGTNPGWTLKAEKKPLDTASTKKRTGQIVSR